LTYVTQNVNGKAKNSLSVSMKGNHHDAELKIPFTPSFDDNYCI